MNKKYILEFFKCRNVKTPEKHGNAAGWDFFIPNDLTIFDFTKNIDVYINDYMNISLGEFGYIVPLDFEVKINDIYKLFNIVIQPNNTNKYTLKIVEKVNDFYEIYSYLNKDYSLSTDILESLMLTPINKIVMYPGSKILIPSGIHVKLPANIFLNAENKSGIASKRGLIKLASLIDSDYQGEIHINLANITKENINISLGEKIIQFVPYFQPNMKDVKEYSSLEKLYENTKSIRGAGGFGSSGIK